MRIVLLTILAIATAPAPAADWPQFHGPKRDNKSTDTGLFQSAPVESSYKYKNGCLTYADGMLYLYADNGNMALVRPTESGLELAGRLKIEDPGERPT